MMKKDADELSTYERALDLSRFAHHRFGLPAQGRVAAVGFEEWGTLWGRVAVIAEG
jgi:hypothetical protein